MKTYVGNAVKNQNLLNIILSLTLVLTVVFSVSCKLQTPEPAPPTMPDGTPLAPGDPEEPTSLLQIEVAITASGFNPSILPPPPPDPSSLPPNALPPAPAPNLPVGTIVVWYNNDSVVHTLTARDNSFDSGDLSTGDTFQYIFEQPGELEYYCTIHTSMVGKITIE